MDQLNSTGLIQTYGARELSIQTYGTRELSRYPYLVGRLIIQEREQASEATQLYWFKNKFEVFTIYFIYS